MNYLKKPEVVIFVLLIVVAAVFIFLWRSTVQSASYADLTTALTTTTATFGTLLGVITAGLMFTQGTFSQLASELNDKAPTYLVEALSMENIQSTTARLLDMRKKFAQLAATTAISEERDLYNRIATDASSLFVDFAVILNLKLRQQGLPTTDVSVSEMDSALFNTYQKRKRSIRREWQLLNIIKQIVDTWEGQTAFFIEPASTSSLKANLQKSSAILKIKEKVEKVPTNLVKDVTKSLSELDDGFSQLSKRLHDDRIPQLLSQMEQASALRGKYFYLTLIFIAAPLLINLIILPQLSQATAAFFQPIILATSLLSIMGVVFLFLYIYRILNT